MGGGMGCLRGSVWGAGVGVGMLRGAGIALLAIKKDLKLRFFGCLFLVVGFLVSNFVMFSKDICYILPNFNFMVFYRYWSHLHAFEQFFTRIFLIFGARLFDI